MVRILGLYREKKLAGKPEADNQIADAVGNALRRKPLVETVEMMRSEGLRLDFPYPQLIFSMARGPDALSVLSCAAAHAPVVNTPAAVQSCLRRSNLHDTMAKAGIPFPETRVFKEHEVLGLVPPFVLKRTATHGKSRDTLLISSKEDIAALPALIREIDDSFYLVQELIGGRTFKFYGIGNEIFPLAFADAASKPKIAELADYARGMARCLDLDVFGGDFIYTSRNEFYFVDVNDWPSFSAIRAEAAEKIADLLLARTK
ncbi:MAG: hypothetical protein AB1529_04410 [Candidatus Micrarchaeota archaeon]